MISMSVAESPSSGMEGLTCDLSTLFPFSRPIARNLLKYLVSQQNALFIVQTRLQFQVNVLRMIGSR